MKNKRTLRAFFILNICLFFAIGAIAGEKFGKAERVDDNQYQAEKTRKLISNTLVGQGSEVVGDANQFFLISLDKNVGVMRNNSDDADKGITWIVSVSRTTIENEAEAETEVVEAVAVMPEEFALNQNYPNPFNPSTTINFQLPDKNGNGTIRTVLKIYDILGRLVRTVVDEDLSPGFYTRQWDGLNDKGLRIGSGVYFYTLSADNFKETKKMLVVK